MSPAEFSSGNEPKPEMSLAQLLAENRAAEERRWIMEEYRKHRIDGCPVDPAADGSFSHCLFHGSGDEKPLPGWPDPGRHHRTPQPQEEQMDPKEARTTTWIALGCVLVPLAVLGVLALIGAIRG